MVSQEGFEPSTLALKGRYSTTELLAHEFATFFSAYMFVKLFGHCAMPSFFLTASTPHFLYPQKRKSSPHAI